jgi:antitoxin component YwqK of YwqJK toxin-antitoxin module
MRFHFKFLLIPVLFVGRSAFGQQLTLIRDSVMTERMKSGYANKHFKPKGSYGKDGARTGTWKDYEVVDEGSYQEVDHEPMKTLGKYLLYGEGQFENNQRTGDWKVFVIEDKTDNKILSETLSYTEGIPEGHFTYFYPNGDKAQEGNYRQGKMEGVVTIYYTSGPVFGKQLYKEGTQQGRQDYFYRSGRPKFYVIYENGVRDGKSEQRYENGNLKESFDYKQDSVNGVYRYFYPDGKLWTEKEYVHGRLINVISIYDKKEKSLNIGDFKNGNGTVNYYDENGNIYQRTTYRDGREIKNETIHAAKFE